MSDLKKVFTEIYDSNSWTSFESRSGLGSELSSTETIRKELPEVFKKFNIKNILDIPCGDFNWMSHVDMKGIEYVGADIVHKMIEDNKKQYQKYNFQVLDITKDELPKVDLIFVRDVLGHFDYESIENSIKNMIRSGSKYLLTTSFTKWDYNVDIQNGDWRPINLMIKPFFFKPLYLINENCFEGDYQYDDKCLLLFELDKLFCGVKGNHKLVDFQNKEFSNGIDEMGKELRLTESIQKKQRHESILGLFPKKTKSLKDD